MKRIIETHTQVEGQGSNPYHDVLPNNLPFCKLSYDLWKIYIS